MQQIFISKHASSAVQVASVTATLYLKRNMELETQRANNAIRDIKVRVVTCYSHCVFSATWECVMLMGGTFDKGFVSGTCDWLKETALITNFKSDANF